MENLPEIRQEKSLFFDIEMFEHAQRVAKMLTSSTMVPEHFRTNIGNCIIALNYANRVGIDPFMAMQKMYIIHGKPAIETQLQIALFNNSGRFTALKFELSGEGDERKCVAIAKEKATGETVTGPPCSIAMAKSEGWYGKTGSKWKTLPELMLRYRAAAFFIRLNAPETTLGLHTTEELYDSPPIDITPVITVDHDTIHGHTPAIDTEKLKAELSKPKATTAPTPEPEQEEFTKELQESFQRVWDMNPELMKKAGELNKINPSEASPKQAKILITAVGEMIKRNSAK